MTFFSRDTCPILERERERERESYFPYFKGSEAMQFVVLYPINLSQVYEKANELQFIHMQVYKKANELQFIKSIEVMQLDPPICWATMF